MGGRLWGGEFELLTLGACGVWVYVTLPSVYILLRPDNVGEVLSYTPSMLITLNPRKTQRISVRGLSGTAQNAAAAVRKYILDHHLVTVRISRRRTQTKLTVS